ncbi:MAG: LPS export ABC transporter permease LptG [Proteobacteria bacterium]|nr:MAG: LPS export ABC transporter permease LptG [Pseudomonadota bacterium]
MPVLARYLMRSILAYTAMVVLVLLALSGLYEIIAQQDDVGVGTFSMRHAFLVAGLRLPQYAFDLLPIAALIGALLALGNLARAMELVVVRAAGVSTARIAWWVAGAGLVLAAATAVVGEYLAPPMERYARQVRTFEKYQDYSMAGTQSAWAKDGDTIISVRQQSADNRYGGVYIFDFDAQRRLRSVAHANGASIEGHNRWRLEGFSESRLEDGRVVARHAPQAEFETNLSPEFLGLAIADPDALPLVGLYGYVQYLRQNRLEADRYETAFWARIARTAAVPVVVMLAVPFAFGPMRSTGSGVRTVIGIMIGVAFFLFARLLESGGAVFGIPPFVVAWAPTVLLAALTAAAIARVR